MNWYKISQIQNIMYHNTSAALVNQILKEGLKINSPYVKSQASQWFIPDIYKMNPIFLSSRPDIFKEKGDITLTINISGLSIVTDIPSLTGFGAYYSDLGDGIYFETGKTPKQLKDFEDEEGMLDYSELLDPHSELTRTCIKLTKTAACMENIEPNRIKLL